MNNNTFYYHSPHKARIIYTEEFLVDNKNTLISLEVENHERITTSAPKRIIEPRVTIMGKLEEGKINFYASRCCGTNLDTFKTDCFSKAKGRKECEERYVKTTPIFSTDGFNKEKPGTSFVLVAKDLASEIIKKSHKTNGK